ncbi:hypothetical protein R3P38DRAFT_2790401 [Favolaschia claudopus]|uniref:Uncharacterized protein n=1 Tax=Favolaschia claudopus TaxID=2862362 RepID=A0AAW0AKV4_9AGAR
MAYGSRSPSRSRSRGRYRHGSSRSRSRTRYTRSRTRSGSPAHRRRRSRSPRSRRSYSQYPGPRSETSHGADYVSSSIVPGMDPTAVTGDVLMSAMAQYQAITGHQAIKALISRSTRDYKRSQTQRGRRQYRRHQGRGRADSYVPSDRTYRRSPSRSTHRRSASPLPRNRQARGRSPQQTDLERRNEVNHMAALPIPFVPRPGPHVDLPRVMIYGSTHRGRSTSTGRERSMQRVTGELEDFQQRRVEEIDNRYRDEAATNRAEIGDSVPAGEDVEMPSASGAAQPSTAVASDADLIDLDASSVAGPSTTPSASGEFDTPLDNSMGDAEFDELLDSFSNFPQ